MKLKALIAASLLLSPLACFASTANITEVNPYARATPPNAPTSAVFTEIVNSGNTDRVIVGASTPAAGKAELQEVIKSGDLMEMRHIQKLAITANGKLTLKPGSFHIMLFDLKKDMQPGSDIKVTLTFANGDKQTFTAPIKKVMSGMKMSHKM